jgi:hypothetical protein
MSNKTTILLEKSTREKLSQIGKKFQTYDESIQELIALKESAA